MKPEQFIEKVKYAIIAWDGNEVVHQCLYVDEPTENDISHLMKEIRIDDDFGVGSASDDWKWYVIVKEEHRELWSRLEASWGKLDSRLDNKHE